MNYLLALSKLMLIQSITLSSLSIKLIPAVILAPTCTTLVIFLYSMGCSSAFYRIQASSTIGNWQEKWWRIHTVYSYLIAASSAFKPRFLHGNKYSEVLYVKNLGADVGIHLIYIGAIQKATLELCNMSSYLNKL